MSKVSVVLYYWILVAAVLLFAKTFGLADNDTAIIKILVVVTIIYVGVVLTVFSKGKKLLEKQNMQKQKSNSGISNTKRKKKK